MSEYHHGNLKEVLLEQGLQLLAEEGYRDFSLRKLARKCGVSHTSPYRHFADKDELVRAISRRVHQEFNRALKDAMEGVTGSPRDRLNAMGKGYVRFFLDHPDYLELLFLSPDIRPLHDGIGLDGDSPFQTYLAAVAPLVGPADSGEDVSGEALQPWCLIHGLTVLLVKKAIPLSSPDETDRLIDQVLGI